MDRATIIKILNNDAKILDLARRREARPGLWVISFPGELMPDTHDFEWQYRGSLERAVLVEFCNQVRREYERQASSQASPSSGDDTRVPSGGGDGGPPGESGGAAVAAAPAVPDVEVSMEDRLQAEVDRLRTRKSDLQCEIRRLATERDATTLALRRASKALGVYREESDTTTPEGTSDGSGGAESDAGAEGPADHGSGEADQRPDASAGGDGGEV